MKEIYIHLARIQLDGLDEKRQNGVKERLDAFGKDELEFIVKIASSPEDGWVREVSLNWAKASTEEKLAVMLWVHAKKI